MQFQYSICKQTGISFVSKPLVELNPNMQLLLYYLDYYYRFSELDKDERPAPEIMRNHFLCDEWVRIYIANLDRQKKESKSGYRGNSKETDTYEF